MKSLQGCAEVLASPWPLAINLYWQSLSQSAGCIGLCSIHTTHETWEPSRTMGALVVRAHCFSEMTIRENESFPKPQTSTPSQSLGSFPVSLCSVAFPSSLSSSKDLGYGGPFHSFAVNIQFFIHHLWKRPSFFAFVKEEKRL